MPIFPRSGVPCNQATGADCSIAPTDLTTECEGPTWYSNRCKTIVDPANLNTIISELVNVGRRAAINWDCTRYDNLSLAIRYLIQRGQTKGAIATGGPNNYTAALDPTLTGYNDYLFINVIPALTNQGPVRIDVDGRGLVRVLRNDGDELKFDDFRAGIPVTLVYYQGAFFLPYLARSQVPVVLNGNINAWIRTDGNDGTGDGTENTPEKAFRTSGEHGTLSVHALQRHRFSASICALAFPACMRGQTFRATVDA